MLLLSKIKEEKKRYSNEKKLGDISEVQLLMKIPINV
jgi:hypothetical protein